MRRGLEQAKNIGELKLNHSCVYLTDARRMVAKSGRVEAHYTRRVIQCRLDQSLAPTLRCGELLHCTQGLRLEHIQAIKGWLKASPQIEVSPIRGCEIGLAMRTSPRSRNYPRAT